MMFEFDATIGMSFLFSVAVLVFTWFRTRRHNVDDRFKAGSERMDRHDQRLLSLEKDVAATPAKEDLHGLQLQMAEMTGSLREMNAIMEGNSKIMGRLESMVTRHDQYLLDGGK